MLKHAFLIALTVMPAFAVAATPGQDVYDQNCSVCHQAAGAGSTGQFPPLKGRVDKIASSPDGKKYLADVVLNGLHGPITAAGSPYAGFMPSLKSLSDDQIASALTYLISLGDTKPAPTIDAAVIAGERSTPKKSKEILAERKALDDAHLVP
ncbi:cytochrome c-552 class I [Neokomagataea thailandica NBRC 106555]|uniref:Cytochrome c n=2 Tax=Neokomagataea TaxID=1223423 RepID=A0A4Y6V6B3_9PROT|nr:MULTISPECIES: cytochrome c [Neokomagataea]QDH25513.1 cytochrome c [Neokomagataea tanensis]GBR55053.1 cytochrome c-552 class I [Neokomagataea thailandica NBRC 106555]